MNVFLHEAFETGWFMVMPRTPGSAEGCGGSGEEWCVNEPEVIP